MRLEERRSGLLLLVEKVEADVAPAMEESIQPSLEPSVA